MKRWGRCLGLALCLSLLSACDGAFDFIRGYAEGHSKKAALAREPGLDPATRGQIYFMHGDFGGLNTDTLKRAAFPWKLAAAAICLDAEQKEGLPVNQTSLRLIHTRYGWVYPEAVANRPADGSAKEAFGEDPSRPAWDDKPLGMVHGMVSRDVPKVRLDTVNLGCSACHAGRLYDANGNASAAVWLGMPSSSLDLSAYTHAIYHALTSQAKDSGRMLGAVRRLYPDLDKDEEKTLRKLALPALQKQVTAFEKKGESFFPFDPGAPGLTNGAAALKNQMRLDMGTEPGANDGFTSVPELGYRRFRSALLYDAIYSPPGDEALRVLDDAHADDEHLKELSHIVLYFLVPTMSIQPEKLPKLKPLGEDVAAFLARYQAPPFPGKLSGAKAERGFQAYGKACQSCHGVFEKTAAPAAWAAKGRPFSVKLVRFPNEVSPVQEIGTDPVREAMSQASMVAAVNKRSYGLLQAKKTGGYAATVLSGLWASAPYLHNGSVPTLWHLAHPAQRPVRFMTGGHRLDYEKVGVEGVLDAQGTYVYKKGYVPFSNPAIYDTTLNGKHNSGHEVGFKDLSEKEKDDLLEFLKLL
jgi:mono/diheme cytochrome c family protein